MPREPQEAESSVLVQVALRVLVRNSNVPKSTPRALEGHYRSWKALGPRKWWLTTVHWFLEPDEQRCLLVATSLGYGATWLELALFQMVFEGPVVFAQARGSHIDRESMASLLPSELCFLHAFVVALCDC